VLFDLGVSSPQLAEPARGFSFAHDGPLDMRMDTSAGASAAEWLAAVPERELADVLFRYGEEPAARKVAAAIVRARAAEPLTRTQQLADVVAAHAGRRTARIHPATRTFQAIRIAINDELGALERGLQQALELLGERGRLVAISFHSLEDRIVKRFLLDRDDLEILTKKPLTPSSAERARNPRARSAKLRAAEKRNAA
jgi:16S rRNA (cytosine1402-N4)-methyltransferase